jgi:cysteine synthase A
MRVANDVTELVGNTPLVRIRKLTEGAKADVVAKLEFYSPAHTPPSPYPLPLWGRGDRNGSPSPRKMTSRIVRTSAPGDREPRAPPATTP